MMPENAAEVTALLARVDREEAAVREAHETFAARTQEHSKSVAATREYVRKDTLKTIFMFTLLIAAMVWVFWPQPIQVSLWVLLWIGAVVSRHFCIIRKGQASQRKIDAMVEKDIAKSEAIMNETLVELEDIRARLLKVRDD
jgi:hypothetical protein